MIRTISFATLAFALMATGPSFAGSKVSLQSAEAICLDRVAKFAQAASVGDGGGPQPSRIKDQFRACVFAKSGQYPQNELKIRGQVVTLGANG
ncbi:hypothetical protein [Amylibacter sp. IMCC11727]|uniref:hypothetical protein n=1 Tax=Amylibacter sp. IMCC11727 TaxID=3039851 RepID=UPI00244DD38D|nr:hypothetical protein [Amylibacter sp. IMCC11727]WGI22445.1 hypothetical protein QBD29_03235 [Amylibacter sp. IMCC11727]